MKKKIIFTLMFIMALSSITIVSASNSKIGIQINNEIKPLKSDMGEPFLSDSRTFVPLRFVSEELGFKVEWNNETRSATIKHILGDVTVVIGSNKVGTPSGEVKMDVEAFIKNGRTYVPIRFVAEALGFKVDWVPAKNVANYKKYDNDFYVAITGTLGNTVGEVGTDASGITNKVSTNPKDWPETNSKYQKDFDLAKNKELVDYMEKNHKGNYHIAGYTDNPSDIGPAIAFDSKGADHNSWSVYDFSVLDVRKSEGYWQLFVWNYNNSKDVIEKSLFAIAGQADGKYIYDYVAKGRTTPVEIDKWVKTSGGREFYIVTKTNDGTFHILIK